MFFSSSEILFWICVISFWIFRYFRSARRAQRIRSRAVTYTIPMYLYLEYWKYDSHSLPWKGIRTRWFVWLIWYFAELWNCECLSRKPNCQFPRLANLSRTGKSAGVGSSSRTIHSPTPQSDTCGRLHTSGPPLNACAKPSQAEI